MRALKLITAIILLLLSSVSSYGQLSVTANSNANALVNAIVGQGVTVSNVVINCPTGASGTFTNGSTTNLGLNSGMMLTTGKVINAPGPNNYSAAGFNHGVIYNDPNLVAINTTAKYDPCILEFDIIPTCSTLSIQFVFGSDEYPEFIDSNYNDVFGFFITGPDPLGGVYTGRNIALLPSTTIPITIQNVNAGSNSSYFVNNVTNCPYTGTILQSLNPAVCNNTSKIQYDGFTVPLIASIPVVPCSTYHMKLAISDGADGNVDSGVFFASSGTNGGGLFCQGATNMGVTFTKALTCTAPNSGTATANVTGGTSPYTYIWSNAQNSQTATGLTAGTYTVTITDNACSTITGSVTLTTTGPTITISKTDIPCNGGTTGAATVNITGGTAPITIAWSNSVSTASNPNLTAGTYTVTVTDNLGCFATGSVTIAQASTLSATASSTASACGGAGTGTVTVAPTGGTPPYTYVWSNGPTSQSQSNLAAGTYSVTVRDNLGCTFPTSTTVTTPTSFTLAIATTPGNCTAPNTGAINLTVTGGTAPITFIWSNSAITEDISNLTAGTYTVTVTDGNGCVGQIAATVAVPVAVTATIANTPVGCFGGNNGTATVTPTAGTAPYTYLWSNAGNTATINGLAAGTYTVTVTGTGGCTVSVSTTVAQPTALTVTLAATNPGCPTLNNGSITATPAGGTGPFGYLWSNAANTATISNLVAGTYTVTVTDAKSCTATASVALANPPTVSVTVATTNVLCNTPNSGTATATVSTGTSPYTTLWSNAGNTLNITNLAAGTYTVTITDANNCTATASGTVSPSTTPTVTITPTNLACNGNNSGAVEAVGTFTSYTWGHGALTNPSTGLAAGNYNVTVTDAGGCTASATATLTEPSALTLTLTPTPLNCNTPNSGAVSSNAAGGTAPLTYLWSNSATTPSISSLAPGTYSVTVTDANNCTITSSVTLATPNPPTLTINITPVSCAGPNTAALAAVVTGGTAPITYLWSNAANTASLTNIGAGTYSVTITDATGCTAVAAATINPVTPPSVTLNPTNPACNGGATGSLAAVGSFATYTWGHASTTNPSTGLAAGNYSITVTDANNCTASATAVLTEPTALTLTLTPTPLSCNTPNSGAVTSNAGGGTAPLTYLWSNSATTPSLSNLAPGTYSVTVTDANSCTITSSVTLAAPNPPVLTLNVTPVNCTGPNTAAIDAVVTAGTGTQPITYAWSNAANTASISNIGAGTYSVTITDAAGCTATASTTISATAVLPIIPTVVSPKCFGDATGSINVSGPYTSFTWSHGDLNMPSTNLVAGTYSVTVSDNGGCSATQTFTLTEPSDLLLSMAVTTIDCTDPNSGALQANVSGGTQPYNYQWSNAATVAALNTLAAGTYSLTITDANGCSLTASEVLAPNPASSVRLGGNKAICNGEVVLFNLDTITAPMVWHDGSTANQYTATGAETVSVVVNFPNGCQGKDSVQVTVGTEVVLNDINDTTLCIGEWVRYNVGPVGFVYQWSNGEIGPEILIADSGLYVVTATSNCNVAEDSVTVHFERCNCEVFMPSAFSPNGDGVNDLFKGYADCDRVSGYKLEIFDRWGGMVYTTTDFNEGWNGTMSNNLCVSGVYVWQVIYTETINGRKYLQHKKGSVVLLK